ncbi:MAG: helix-turn-helix domain-containing protein [Alteraurantiacibacter sp.]
MGEAFSASTSGVAPGERIAFWNAGSSRIGGVQAVALSDVFDAEVTIRRFEQLCVYRLESTPHRVTTNAARAGGERMLRLRYQQSGSSLIVQGQRSFRLNTGDWMMSDPHQPHIAINEGAAAHLWLQVPCDSLTASEMRTVGRVSQRLAIGGTVAEELSEAMRLAVDAAEAPAPGGERDLANRMTQLVRQALRGLSGAAPCGSGREEVARRARAYIDRHLQDPDLSVERIAAVLGCTSRYLHKIFEGSESVSRYIWSRRLELCRCRLEEQPENAQTLTALAFDYGFNSSSHFSRSFRDRFGTTPSAYLAAMQRGQA